MYDKIIIEGIKGRCFEIDKKDKLAVKMAMLFEGTCTIGVPKALKKYGYSEQRYYQLQKQFREKGSEGVRDKKRGSEKKPVRKEEVINQIIRMRFLDPDASAGVIAQKLNQTGYRVSERSVERTITEYGLQKKRINLTRRKKIKHKM